MGVFDALLDYQMQGENLKLQYDTLQYNKDLQKMIFEREDNAVQRRAADMEAAGLSKTLAAGGGANAGQAIKIEAPQRQRAKDFDFAGTAAQMMAIGQTKAQVDLLKSQKAKTDAETDVEKERAKQMADTTVLSAATLANRIDQMDSQTVLEYNKALKSEQETETSRNANMKMKYEAMIEEMKYEIMAQTGLDSAKAELAARQAYADYAKHETDRYMTAGTVKGGVLPSALTSWLSEFNKLLGGR